MQHHVSFLQWEDCSFHLFILYKLGINFYRSVQHHLFFHHTRFHELPPHVLCHSIPLHMSHFHLYSLPFTKFLSLPSFLFISVPISLPLFLFPPSLPQTHQCFSESKLVNPLVSVIFMSTVPLKYLQQSPVRRHPARGGMIHPLLIQSPQSNYVLLGNTCLVHLST